MAVCVHGVVAGFGPGCPACAPAPQPSATAAQYARDFWSRLDMSRSLADVVEDTARLLTTFAARARREALEEAARYMHHDGDCAAYDGETLPCTCGKRALLAEGK